MHLFAYPYKNLIEMCGEINGFHITVEANGLLFHPLKSESI